MKYHQRARVIWQSTLAPNERFVLLAVSDHLGSNEDCWPSLTRLATMTGLNERTIRRALTSLELAGHITVTRKPGRANRYRVIWETLPTLDTESTPLPRTESHPGHNVQGTPDTESTPLDTESNEADQEADQVNGSITPPTPQGAGDVAQQSKPVDNSSKSAEKPEPTAKKSKRGRALSVEDVCAIPLPIDLQSLEGYTEAFRAYAEHRQEMKAAVRWKSVEQVERFHRGMSKHVGKRHDVVAALEESVVNGYQGVFPKPFRQRAKSSKQSIDDSAEAWQTVEAALDAWGRRSPHGQHGWSFSDDPAEDARYCTAIRVATRRDDLRDAWVHLFENCRHPKRGPQLRSGFGYGWRTAARRSEVAA